MHTPTPWSVLAFSSRALVVNPVTKARVCEMPDSTQPHMPGAQTNAANAAFIVRACNSHDALVAALEKAAWFIENVNPDDPNRSDLFFETREAWRDAFQTATL